MSGVIGRPIDADALDSLRIRLFHRMQGEVRIDFQALFALMAGDQRDLGFFACPAKRFNPAPRCQSGLGFRFGVQPIARRVRTSP
jgi:hypothetical protein